MKRLKVTLDIEIPEETLNQYAQAEKDDYIYIDGKTVSRLPMVSHLLQNPEIIVTEAINAIQEEIGRRRKAWKKTQPVLKIGAEWLFARSLDTTANWFMCNYTVEEEYAQYVLNALFGDHIWLGCNKLLFELLERQYLSEWLITSKINPATSESEYAAEYGIQLFKRQERDSQ